MMPVQGGTAPDGCAEPSPQRLPVRRGLWLAVVACAVLAAVADLVSAGWPGLLTGWWGRAAGTAAAVLALGAVAAVAVTILRARRSLRDLGTTMTGLLSGDGAARAPVTGPPAVAEVARWLNALADENAGMRTQETEARRVRALAAAAGLRIRQHLRSDDVVTEGRRAVERILGADAPYLLLMADGKLRRPVGHTSSWILPDAFLADLQEIGYALFHDKASLVVDDLATTTSAHVGWAVREPLQHAGITSAVITPFGDSRGFLGVVAAFRLATPAQPWTDAEVAAAETIAADLGRGLDHSQQYESEADGSRLRGMARDAGRRIRQCTTATDAAAEARSALERHLDADAVHLRLLETGQPSRAARAPGGFILAELTGTSPSETLPHLAELLEFRTSKIVEGPPTGSPGTRAPAAGRDRSVPPGAGSRLVTPFGIGQDLLGVIVVQRCRPGRPWAPAEIDAVESVATDLGHGLHQIRVQEAEDRLVADLRTVDGAKSQLLASVSHELRTPLTSIAACVELLTDGAPGPLSPMQQKLLDTATRNTGRLKAMIEDLLTLSSIETGAFRTVMRPVDLGDLLSPAVTALAPLASARQLTVSCDGPGQGLLVNGDAGQLDRLLANLLSNALKFTPGGGRVRVSASSENGMGVLNITDTGIGIPESDRKELFTPFFRASNAVEQAIPGTGLGLAIVRTIVANHGGEVAIGSGEGSGTEVTVRIPLLHSRRGKRSGLRVPAARGGLRASA